MIGTDPGPAITKPTYDLLCELLSRVTISASQPDFDEQVAIVGTARRELIAFAHHFD